MSRLQIRPSIFPVNLAKGYKILPPHKKEIKQTEVTKKTKTTKVITKGTKKKGTTLQKYMAGLKCRNYAKYNYLITLDDDIKTSIEKLKKVTNNEFKLFIKNHKSLVKKRLFRDESEVFGINKNSIWSISKQKDHTFGVFLKMKDFNKKYAEYNKANNELLANK